jgi:hypothetical protein
MKLGEIMEPGRELDALIHRHVMNITPKDYGQSFRVSREDLKQTDNHPVRSGCLCGSREWCEICTPKQEITVPRYSELMGPAWQVVEKIDELGLGWMLVMKTSPKAYIAYQCTGSTDPDYGDWFQYGETPEHAMCLAALQAVGV